MTAKNNPFLTTGEKRMINGRIRRKKKWRDVKIRGSSDGYYAEAVSNGTLHFSRASQRTAQDLMIHYNVYSHQQHFHTIILSVRRGMKKNGYPLTRSDF